MKLAKAFLSVALASSALFVGVASAATNAFHFGKNTTAVNDVHIINRTLDIYTVSMVGEPSGASYGSATLGTNYPYNSMWIDFMNGDNMACVTIMRNGDGKVDFSGCVPSGTEIDVPVSAAFQAAHPKK